MWGGLFRDHFHDALADYGGVAREGGHARSGAAMPARIAVEGDEQVGGAVHHLGLLVEVGGAVDHAHHLENAGNPVQAAQLGLHTGQQVQGAETGGGVAFFGGQVCAELAGDGDAAHLPGADAGQPHDVAAAGRRQVIARRRGRRRQGIAEVRELGFYLGFYNVFGGVFCVGDGVTSGRVG